MIYDIDQYHNYKDVIGLIHVYSRLVDTRPLTNMRIQPSSKPETSVRGII